MNMTREVAAAKTEAKRGTRQVGRNADSAVSASGFNGDFDALSSWGTFLARLILGLVLAWFGYHELVVPKLWTGYIPVLSPSSTLSQLLVLIHGVVLSVLAIGLIAGVMPRLLAGVSAVVMLEIVASLTITAGLSDLVLRDIGVLGLALAVMASHHERLILES